jgi:branched-chain amino acid transport system permease protein
VLAVVALVALFALSSRVDAFTDYNLAAIASLAIAAAGLTVLTGVNGQVSLGHGALMAIGAYATALVSIHLHLPVALTIASAVVTSILAGLIVGVAAARLRGPYLAGATLALAVAVPQLATHFSGTLGGEQGLAVTPLFHPAGLGPTFPDERWLAWVSFVAAAGAFVLLANLKRGRFGRSLRAVRDDEVAAALAGIPVARIQVLAFVISAGAAGLAGSLFAYWSGIAAPSGFALGLSLQLLTAIVLGGVGSLTGAVWGAALLVYLPTWTNHLATRFSLPASVGNNLPLAIYGVVLIVVMLGFPEGIQGALRRAAARIRRDRPPEEGVMPPVSG